MDSYGLKLTSLNLSVQGRLRSKPGNNVDVCEDGRAMVSEMFVVQRINLALF